MRDIVPNVYLLGMFYHLSWLLGLSCVVSSAHVAFIRLSALMIFRMFIRSYRLSTKPIPSKPFLNSSMLNGYEQGRIIFL